MSEEPRSPERDGIEPADDPIVQPIPLSRGQRMIRRLTSREHLRALTRVRIRWPRLIFAAVVLSIAALGVMLALLNSPLLEVKSVSVEGTDAISAAQSNSWRGSRASTSCWPISRLRNSELRRCRWSNT